MTNDQARVGSVCTSILSVLSTRFSVRNTPYSPLVIGHWDLVISLVIGYWGLVIRIRPTY